MFKNYLKIAFRNIKRHKGYSFINIVGLAIGIACCILILLWVRDELSFDMYHNNARQIYRVGAQFGPIVEARGAYTPPPLAEALLNEFPEVQYAVRLSVWPVNLLVRFNEKSFLETNIIWADSSIFDVFTIPLIKGNPRTVLTRPRNVVINEDISQKYFGNDNPIGKTLNIGNREDLYEITGVAENCPANSHFQYDFIISDNTRAPDDWGGHSRFTYIVLQKGCPPSELEAKFPDFIKKYKADYIQREYGLSFDEYYADEENYIGFWLQPLKDIHLNASIEQNLPTRGNKLYIYVFSIIALFILLIACVNFINLSTARSAYRSKEVGLRKVVGSNRLQLIRQFLGESLILSFIALCLSIVIISSLLPAFNNFTNKQLELNLIHNFDILFALVGIAVIVGFLSGIYPALFLSSFLPVAVLKGRLKTNMKNGLFRSGMVVFQFALSIIIVLGTIIVYRQLTYIQNAQLGFDKKHIVVIHRAYALHHQFGAFKQELLQHANIECVSITGTLPGRHFDDNGHRLEGAPLSEEYFLFTGYVDFDFARLLNLEVIKGRFFSPGISTDATSSVVINETTARELGLDHPVGRRFRKEFGGAEEGEFVTIIGVVRDFHFQSLHQKIQPMILRPLIAGEARFASVKISSGNIGQMLRLIEKTWNKFTGNQPFKYSFLDDDFNSLYQAEQKLGKIFTLFSILSIVIACSGLFALACYATEQRTKEIGIRKVLGASALSIIQLVTKEFTKWMLIANIIACPIAWYVFDKWLQNFAYRTNIGIWIFLLSGVLALIVALLTVSYQSIKAAMANPVESLRYE